MSTPPAKPADPKPVRVTVVDFDVSFGQMIWLLVKLALAAIPALFILGVIGIAITVALMAAQR